MDGTVTVVAALDGEHEGIQAEDAAAELYRDLEKYLPDSVQKQEVADAGDKGAETDVFNIALALVSSGTVTAMVGLLREWLHRMPARRSVVVKDGAGKVICEVTADNVDDEATVAAINLATTLSKH